MKKIEGFRRKLNDLMQKILIYFYLMNALGIQTYFFDKKLDDGFWTVDWGIWWFEGLREGNSFWVFLFWRKGIFMEKYGERFIYDIHLFSIKYHIFNKI